MTTEYHNQSGNTNPSKKPFIIGEYLHLLEKTKHKNEYICPVCSGNNLSIKSDGLKYSCYSGCTGNQIAYKLRELNNEYDKVFDPLQYYNNGSISLAKKQAEADDEVLKLNNNPKALKYLTEIYGHRIAYNTRTNQVEIDGVTMYLDTIHIYLAKFHNVDLSHERAASTLLYLAKQNEYDPVKEYLERCKNRLTKPLSLDGLSRLFFGTEEALYDEYFKRWLIACVARVYEPGCKLDEALVLQGKPGIRKTTFFRTIAAGFFSNSMTEVLDKDDLLILSKAWILEWGELEKFTGKVYHGKIKHFLSRQEDTYRRPYAVSTECVPRRSVIVGTTNETNFFVDPTGNRRFWIIPVKQKIDLEFLERVLEDLWGSAVHAYLAGEPWRLPEEFLDAQAEDNRQYDRDDPWEEIILSYLETQYHSHTQEYLPVTSQEIRLKLEEAGCKVDWHPNEQMRIAGILKKEGWEQKKTRIAGHQARRWHKIKENEL